MTSDSQLRNLEKQLFETAGKESPEPSVREETLNRLRELARSGASMSETTDVSRARGFHRLRPYAWSILSAASLAAAAGFALIYAGHGAQPSALLVTSEQLHVLKLPSVESTQPSAHVPFKTNPSAEPPIVSTRTNTRVSTHSKNRKQIPKQASPVADEFNVDPQARDTLRASGVMGQYMRVPMSQQAGNNQASAPAASDKSQCTPAPCTPVKPSNGLIVDFTDVSPTGVFVDNDHFSAPNPNWWLNFYGSPYVYPESKPGSVGSAQQALSHTTAGHWNISGSISNWSGFGLWLGACTVDMSAYKGVAFDIGGHVGQSGHVTLFVSTGPDLVPEQCRTNVGHCDAKANRCTAPSHRILVNSKMTNVELPWSDFVGGSPRSTPDPHEIIGLMWAFDWTDWGGKKSEPYAVDVTLDNIRLIE